MNRTCPCASAKLSRSVPTSLMVAYGMGWLSPASVIVPPIIPIAPVSPTVDAEAVRPSAAL
jgi:hypothetical protein